jgi:hypothetical protein
MLHAFMTPNYFSNIMGYKSVYDRKSVKNRTSNLLLHWKCTLLEVKEIVCRIQENLVGLGEVNQHFRDHMCIHHHGSDMPNETVSPSQVLVYSNNLVHESAKEYSV